MNREDLFYLCTMIGNLTGIPLRVFENDEQIFYHALVGLPKDPMEIFREEIWAVSVHVGYFATTFFDYYGIVNAPPYKIVIGPTQQVERTDQELRAQAFASDVPTGEVDSFVEAMQNIVRMPLDSILQMLCTVNYVLNHEKLSLKDIAVYGVKDSEDRYTEAESGAPLKDAQIDRYTSYAVERQLMDIVSSGDTVALGKWVASAPAIRAGKLSDNQLRQLKNIFIVTAALASRAAISGGLDMKTAFFLSDGYIQQCELLKNHAQISNLQFQMISDYTGRVERVRIGKRPTQLSISVANYVHAHLSEVITVDALARSLLLSRSRLTARFKEETGKTLTDFSMQIKIEEAKRLLRYTDKSLSAMSDYLGFSSQSHFSRIFKKYVGIAPGEYRAASE